MPNRLLTAGTPLPYHYLLGLLEPNEILVATMFPSDPSVHPAAVPNLTQADYDLAVSKFLVGELKVLRFFASESASSDYFAYFADRGMSYAAIIDKPDPESSSVSRSTDPA